MCYPKARDKYELKSGVETILQEDGDINYLFEYQVDPDAFRSMFLEAFPEYKVFASLIPTQRILNLVFNSSYTYAALMDKYQWEVVIQLDEYLSAKLKDGKPEFVCKSDFFELVSFSFDSDTNIGIATLQPKSSMKFASTRPNL